MRCSENIYLILALVSLATGCARANPPDYTGVVYDAATKAPLKGVLVLANYTQSGGVMFGHSGTWCVKSMALHTDSRGSFRFPIEKNRYGPTRVAVFLPGYYTKEQLIIETQDPIRSYSGSGHDFFLAKQDPENIELRFTSYVEPCDRAVNKVDAEAAKHFRERVEAERTRLKSLVAPSIPN